MRSLQAALIGAAAAFSLLVVHCGGGGSGGGSGGSGSTPSGTYPIQVNATSNGVQHSITVTLTVD